MIKCKLKKKKGFIKNCYQQKCSNKFSKTQTLSKSTLKSKSRNNLIVFQ